MKYVLTTRQRRRAFLLRKAALVAALKRTRFQWRLDAQRQAAEGARRVAADAEAGAGGAARRTGREKRDGVRSRGLSSSRTSSEKEAASFILEDFGPGKAASFILEDFGPGNWVEH